MKLKFVYIFLAIATIWGGLFTSQAHASFAFVQAATSTDNLSGITATCNVQFPANITAGDLVVVNNSSKIATTTVTGITDGTSDAFALFPGAITSSTSGGGVEGELWYVLNSAGGSKSVTSTMVSQAGGGGVNCIAAEFSGVSAIDVGNASSSGTGAVLMNSGTSTTNFANELIIGAGGTPKNNTAITPGVNYTKVSSSTGSRSIMEYQIVSSAGNYSATATSSASNQFSMEMATFYTPAAGGTTAPAKWIWWGN